MALWVFTHACLQCMLRQRFYPQLATGQPTAQAGAGSEPSTSIAKLYEQIYLNIRLSRVIF